MKEKLISQRLRILFIGHAILGAIFGVPLLLIPGRFLVIVGWRPEWVQFPPEWGIPPEIGQAIPGTTFVDPFLTRILGAALVGLALSSFLGSRASYWGEVKHLVALEGIFSLLAVVAFLIRLPSQNWSMPTAGWIAMVILALFAAGWLIEWQNHRRNE